MAQPVRVLFVCLGNICRSPLAEATFRHLVREAGLEQRFHVDSAGTSSYHEGQAPDARAAEIARRHGLALSGRARPITADDIRRVDYAIVMDAENLRDVRRLADGVRRDAEVHLLREF
ncbi:MAG: low molecular weight phosphotyrosine protein phosphatase, partial [Gemmatimonadetes bacterium]|nr:low molecular weight phosphotyrosine protein phosphatase [Gemmatimonadota bacterium]